MLNEWAVKILLALSGLLGVTTTPVSTSERWTLVSDWTPNQNGHGVWIEFKSNSIPNMCAQNLDSYLVFPVVVHGAHELFLDGRLIHSFGKPDFSTNQSFYGSPVISCKNLAQGSQLNWRAYSYTRYFARLSKFPVIRPDLPLTNVAGETLNVLAAGILLVMSLFTAVIFSNKVPNRITFAVSISSFLISFYFASSVSGLCGVNISMLTAHKVADTGLWLGMIFFFFGFVDHGLISKTLFRFYVYNTAVAILVVLLGNTGDIIQLGTSLPFPMTFAMVITAIANLVERARKTGILRRTVLETVGAGTFLLVALNDMSVITGLTHGVMLLPLGLVGGLFFFSLSVEDQIRATYEQRDYLLKNLENEVALKTKEIRLAQAELVESAKLASLGTLSAGIAHEINSSLNYVNGALLPLEKKLLNKNPEAMTPENKKLIEIMKDGLRLTFEIIKSLRNYTGLNQAKLGDLNLREVIHSVLTIVKSKLREKIVVEVDVPEHLRVFGSVVGLHQVFMNLVTNAVDAMPKGGTLRIRAEVSENSAKVIVQDTGDGMPPEILEKIFDPFFTTKEVGKGTGLGLHIVRTEIERHSGNLNVKSELGQGTTFVITLPIQRSGEIAHRRSA